MGEGEGGSEVGNTSERHRCGRRSITIRATGTCHVVSIGSPVSLAIKQKPAMDDENKKLNTSLTNRQSESDLNMQKLSATNKLVGRRFLLYTAVL